MIRRVFYSFHYKPDCWRVSKVRNIGMIEDNLSVTDNDWETITRGGDAAIQRWIDGQLSGRSCTIVLVGANTAGRKWINYEIRKSWMDRKGMLGIYIHNLTDQDGLQCRKGRNPFEELGYSSIVRTYDPPGADSQSVYRHIAQNLSAWVEDAIRIRQSY